jgi:hypothetical protein
MTIRPYDVYWAKVNYGHSTDARPCIVLEVLSGNRVVVAMLSSAMPLFNSLIHFAVTPTHPDFKATGLKRDSYVEGTELHVLESDELIRIAGRFEGDLAREFENWIG